MSKIKRGAATHEDRMVGSDDFILGDMSDATYILHILLVDNSSFMMD